MINLERSKEHDLNSTQLLVSETQTKVLEGVAQVSDLLEAVAKRESSELSATLFLKNRQLFQIFQETPFC